MQRLNGTEDYDIGCPPTKIVILNFMWCGEELTWIITEKT